MVRRYFATELQRVDAARLGELHRQLAGWYTVAGMYTQAFDHVLATGSDELLVDFLRAEGVAATLLGCGAAVLEMLDQAQPALSNDPFVWMLRVIDALERGDAAQAHAYLDLVRARGGDTESVAPPEWLRALLLGGRRMSGPSHRVIPARWRSRNRCRRSVAPTSTGTSRSMRACCEFCTAIASPANAICSWGWRWPSTRNNRGSSCTRSAAWRWPPVSQGN
ncbi:ATP-dependent transcriptional regulator [Mycobacteroides abscessus subsp. abscessus]|nr:ATP-dependent transcriptional regulator [Mycobacteroides abscessus subsp. abscessus]